MQKEKKKEVTSLMNAHSYWNQAQGEIPDDKTSTSMSIALINMHLCVSVV